MNSSQAKELLPTAELHFDRENPRLAEFGVTPKSTDEEILSILWDVMDVRELVQSIAASGYFEHEPLIVAVEGKKNVVIEGNRRLAAVRVLLNPKLVQVDGGELPKLSADRRRELASLPAVMGTREDTWRFLGFKHVNGPAKWSSYAKAKYIADVHRTYNVPLADIAEQIGDRHKTVQRLYRGLMVLEQAERAKVYDREDRFRQRFAFSHLYTGLDYDGFASYLSPSDNAESRNPIPKRFLKQLGEVCVWLYGSKKQNKAPIVESQNPHLRQLNEVLKNREAVAALRSGEDLASAFEISRPPLAVFEESLLKAKRELQRARANLTTGYDGSEDLLRIASEVSELASDIHSEMERKRTPKKRDRISGK